MAINGTCEATPTRPQNSYPISARGLEGFNTTNNLTQMEAWLNFDLYSCDVLEKAATPQGPNSKGRGYLKKWSNYDAFKIPAESPIQALMLGQNCRQGGCAKCCNISLANTSFFSRGWTSYPKERVGFWILRGHLPELRSRLFSSALSRASISWKKMW